MRALALLALAGLLLVVPAQAADVNGEWSITVNSSQGPIPATLKLKVDGEKLTGVITRGEGGELPLEGTAKDDEITFSFWYGEIPVSMTGKVDGDTIKGTYDAGGQGGGDWSGKRVQKT